MMKDPCRYCNHSYVGCKGACMTLALAYKTNPGHKTALFLQEEAERADNLAKTRSAKAEERAKREEAKKERKKKSIAIYNANRKRAYYDRNREAILQRQRDYVKRERELLERLKAERKAKNDGSRIQSHA